MSRPLHVLVAALAALAIMASAGASAAMALPGNFWGVDPQATPTLEQLERLRRGGVDSIRIPVGWPNVQSEPGAAYEWSGTDSLVENAARAGIEVLPFLSGAPGWAVPSAWVPGSHRTVTAPRSLPVRGAAATAWSSFVSAAVARYGPGGSFWSERPGLAPRPVRTWQIWNEENFKYFIVRPNPAEYGKLVKLSSGAVRSVDPRAKVLLGGLFARPREATYRAKPRQAYFATDFLDQLYRRTPGIRSKFDGVALHPYSTSYRLLTSDIEEFRRVLERHRDAGKGLWITELGWSSGRPSKANGFNAFEKGRKGQAAQLKGAFGLLKRHQAKWRVRQVFWFSVDDQPGACNFCDGSGLFGPGFAAKPSWFAYVRFAGGHAS
jgi:hypothetical protein